MPSNSSPHPKSVGERPDSIQSLLRHASIYSITPIFQRLLGLVLVGVYTAVLPAGEYGLLGVIALFLSIFPLLIGTSILAGVSRHYFLYDDPKDRSSVISGAAIALVVSSSAGAALILTFREPIAGFLFAAQGSTPSPALVDYISICALLVPFSLLTRTGTEALQAQKRSKAVVVISLAKTLLETALKLYFLFVPKMGVLGFLYAMLIGEMLAGTAFAIYIARVHGKRLLPRTFKPLFIYSLPLIPMGIFQLCLHQADTLLIQRLGPTDVIGMGADGVPLTVASQWLGVYFLGYQIPFLFHTAVMGSFMRIWAPSVFALNDEPASRENMRRIGTLVALCIGGLYAQVALFGREAIQLVGRQEAYQAANEVVPWVALGYVAYALYGLSQVILMKVFAVGLLAALNAVALGVNLLLNVLWIPEYGSVGAAAATTVSFSVLALSAAWVSGRRGFPPFSSASVLVGFLLVAGAAIAGAAIDQATAPWAAGGLAAKAAISVAMIMLLLVSLPTGDRKRLLESLPGRR